MAWTFETEYALIILALMGTGLISGTLSGLLGVGGGIVIVPALFHLLDPTDTPQNLHMHIAVGTSLAAIIPTAISSTLSHHRYQAVDYTSLKSWAPSIILGVLFAGLFSGQIQGEVLAGFFACVAILVAGHMLIFTSKARTQISFTNPAIRVFLGALIGCISTLMGIGGATLSVPILMAHAIPAHRAVGTASAIGLVIALPGATAFALNGLDLPGRPPGSLGYINIPGAVLITATSIFTAPFGARLAHNLSPQKLKALFGFFLLMTGCKMLWEAFY